MNKEQHEMLKYITRLSFAMDDVVLFLDTHPCSKEALETYNELREERSEAVDKYTCKFGPIQKYDVRTGCSWNWSEGPWPWEYEGGNC